MLITTGTVGTTMDMSLAFPPCETVGAARMAAQTIGACRMQNELNADNLVILMGQEHNVLPIELAQAVFVNTLNDSVPFVHACHELSDAVWRPRAAVYQDDPAEGLVTAADRFAQNGGDAVRAIQVVNMARHRKQNHFIDLRSRGPGDGGYPDCLPSLIYYKRYRDNPLLGKIFRENAEMFAHANETAGLAYSVLQRDVQMTGRIDDILMKKEGCVVANVGLGHVHDCLNGSDPTLTDFLLGIGRDVITLSFEHSGTEYAKAFADFRARHAVVAPEHAATAGPTGRYPLHLFMTMAV